MSSSRTKVNGQRSRRASPVSVLLMALLALGCDAVAEGVQEAQGVLTTAQAEQLLRARPDRAQEWRASMGVTHTAPRCTALQGGVLLRAELAEFTQRAPNGVCCQHVPQTSVPFAGRMPEDREMVAFIRALEDAGYLGSLTFQPRGIGDCRSGSCTNWRRTLTAPVRHTIEISPAGNCSVRLGVLGPIRVTRVAYMNDEVAEAQYERVWEIDEARIEFVRRWPRWFDHVPRQPRPLTGRPRFRRWSDGWRLQ